MTVADSGTGLGHITIHLKQKDQDVVLADETFDKATAPKTKTYDVGKLMVDKYKIQDGPATLTVVATDHALRHFLKGNQAQATKDFQFSVTPPQLEVLSGQHYINQGGSVRGLSVSSNVECRAFGSVALFPGISCADAKRRQALLCALRAWV
jgi:hypothetical protein